MSTFSWRQRAHTNLPKVATCLPIEFIVNTVTYKISSKFHYLIHTYFFYPVNRTSRGFRDQCRPEQSDHFFHHALSFQASPMTSLLARTVVSFRALMFITTTMIWRSWFQPVREGDNRPSNFCSGAKKHQSLEGHHPRWQGPRLPSRKD